MRPEQAGLYRQLGVGVAIAGAEFGMERPGFSNKNPGLIGVDYTTNGSDTINRLAGLGLNTLRIPFSWERIQPRLGGDLESAELRRLTANVDAAAAADVGVILDLHNYCRYVLDVDGQPTICIVDDTTTGPARVTRQHLADVWRRLAEHFRDHEAVVAYGIMNEPHDMGDADWKLISQHVVNETRRVDHSTLLLIAGEGWSHAHRFGEVNGPNAWIDDPASNIAYEAHCYFDHDHSGKYSKTYQEELRLDPRLPQRPIVAVRPFIEWLRKNSVAGFVGESGVPADEPAWFPLLKRFAAYLSEEQTPMCYWAAGEWWGDYRLSVQPTAEEPVAPQMRVLLDAVSDKTA